LYCFRGCGGRPDNGDAGGDDTRNMLLGRTYVVAVVRPTTERSGKTDEEAKILAREKPTSARPPAMLREGSREEERHDGKDWNEEAREHRAATTSSSSRDRGQKKGIPWRWGVGGGKLLAQAWVARTKLDGGEGGGLGRCFLKRKGRRQRGRSLIQPLSLSQKLLVGGPGN
jgi:hypothetical protein